MKNLKVVSIEDEEIVFDNGGRLGSHHDQDCCEHHWLAFGDLSMSDFEGLTFTIDLSGAFFDRIPDFGIALKPDKGFPVRVAGYGSNNGYYSSDLSLYYTQPNPKIDGAWDISGCQEEDSY